MAFTGHGATIAFGTTTTYTPDTTSIGGINASRTAIPVPHLGLSRVGSGGSAWTTKIVGDIITPGSLEVSTYWVPASNKLLPPIGLAQETVTITYANADATTIAFPAAVTSFQLSSAESDQPMLLSYTLDMMDLPTVTLWSN